jgi:hypothetical protein
VHNPCQALACMRLGGMLQTLLAWRPFLQAMHAGRLTIIPSSIRAFKGALNYCAAPC